MRLHKLPVIIFLIILSIKSLYAKDLKIERIVGNEIITNIDVENQFNTHAKNGSSELYENYYKDQWNGMFTQARGASPIIPFVLTYIRTASWIYHNATLGIMREQKKEALWGINAISAAETIKDSIKNNVASLPTNLDPEQIKQGLKFEKFWKYLE